MGVFRQMKTLTEMRKEIPKEIIDMASDIHGHMSPGLTAGLKMLLYGLEQIEITSEDKVIIVSESVRCLQDANFAVCNYLIKENNWRIYARAFDVGKFSIQILKNFRKERGKHKHEHKNHSGHSNDHDNDNDTPRKMELFRVVLNPEKVKEYPMFWKWAYQQEKKKAPLKELIADIARAVDEDIFKIIPFSGQMNEFCHVVNKDLIKCPECGESVEKITTIERDGTKICRVCAFFKKL